MGLKPAEEDPRVLVTANGRAELFCALGSISLRLDGGDRVALIGGNGAGKTTLLRVLAGVLPPTSGSYSADGKIQALFDASIGLQPAATGLANITKLAMLRGFPRDQIAERLEGIIEFSGLASHFLKMPVSSYSSGMRVRLLFSTITALDPEILLLDEWFGTADSEFSRRAQDRIDNVVQNAGMIVLASHNINLLRRYCDRALLIDHGRILDDGPIENVHNEFKKLSR